MRKNTIPFVNIILTTLLLSNCNILGEPRVTPTEGDVGKVATDIAADLRPDDAVDAGSSASDRDLGSQADMADGKVKIQGETELVFCDLISGPATGLGDGKGSGVIVTLWGRFLGSQENANVIFKDASGGEKKAVVYYWKKADGQKPGGPANLWDSHRIFEIAISIPESASGMGELYIERAGEVSNSLRFVVRPGSIFHATTSGDDTSGDGSFSAPWKTVGEAGSTAGAGSTIYVHDGITSGGARGV